MSSLKSFAQCCRATATLSRWTSPQYCRGPSTSYRNRKVLEGAGVLPLKALALHLPSSQFPHSEDENPHSEDENWFFQAPKTSREDVILSEGQSKA